MLKYIVLTLAALYGVLMIFGDESRREPVSRNATSAVFDFSFANLAPEVETSELGDTGYIPVISDDDAVAAAMSAGQSYRDSLEATSELRGLILAVETASAGVVEVSQPVEQVVSEAITVAEPLPRWYVSGTRVNLRSGPGTGNEVVAQLGLGTEAEVLSDTSSEWIEIRTSEGTTGWIFSTFLSEQPPA
ncbi:MAG: SH3 domain-containing protein [Boseongicola sp.]|nr:SH3 domain-containing protein [Boseongicola sp.]